EAFDASHPGGSEINISPALVVTTEQEPLDITHPRCANVRAPPPAKYRGSYFADAGALIDQKRARNRWIASGKPAIARHHGFQARAVPACEYEKCRRGDGEPKPQDRSPCESP